MIVGFGLGQILCGRPLKTPLDSEMKTDGTFVEMFITAVQAFVA